MNKTIGEKFVETWCIQKDERHAALLLSPLIRYPRMLEDAKNQIFQEGVVHDQIIMIDSFPAVQIRLKWMNAVRNCGDNIGRIYILLNQLFRAQIIRIVWPDVFQTHEQKESTKQLNRMIHQATFRKGKKFRSRPEQFDHEAIAAWTNCHSSTTATRGMRKMQLSH